MGRRFLCAGLILLAPVIAFAGIMGSDLYLISVGRGPGASESYWYTTVWIHNPGDSSARVTVSLLRRGQPNTSPEQQILTVAPGETLTIGDVLWDLYGEDEASGALRFEADRRIVVSSRIFNLPGTDPAESQGQFMAGMPADLALGFGEQTNIPGITQPADDSFRCNFALVETSGNQVEVEVLLANGNGVELALSSYTLRPYEPIQKNLSHLLGETVVDGGRLQVWVTGGTGRVLALASMVGNGTVSQDPSTLEMEIEMPEGSSSGDITAVHAGEGLTGGGSSGDVTLGIDTAGAAAGQALVYDGAHVGWDSPPGGLTLPYSGSQTTTGAAFKVTNTSTTGNVFGIRGENQSTAGAGVLGWSSANSGLTGGVVGHASSTVGTGVFGLADSTSGENIGVYGMTASPVGRGVYAQAISATGEPTALVAEVAAPEGRAVIARNLDSNVYTSLATQYRGLSTSHGIVGVDAHASRVGGYFQVNGDTGDYGVEAAIFSPGGIGVRAFTNSASGYSFYAAGSGTDYGPFTGAHEVKLASGMPREIRPGLIVTAVGDVELRQADDGEVSLSSTLPTVALGRVPRDSAVLGVLVAERPLPRDHWYVPEEGERFAVINALGEGRVWVTDVNGEIRAGDYITTSSVPGHGQRQDDDVLHSYTLGKAIEAVDWESVRLTVEHQRGTHKAYLIAVVYTSG